MNNNLIGKDFNAGIYIRLSQEDKDKKYESDSESVINQKELLRSYVNSNNFKFTTEQFIRKAEEVHGAKYDYSKVDYKLNSIPVTIICPEHGEFKQRPNDHTSGKKGCRSCCGFGFDKNKSAILYYLSINDGQAYKIGITNRDVSRRFNKVDLEKIKIIKTWEYPLGIDAYKKEKEILKIYSYAKYEGDPLLTDGNTELFNFDILGLIS